MKLAEALMERKAIKTKMEELKKRIYQNAQVQEGDTPSEEPYKLLEELTIELKKFEEIVSKINKTNSKTLLDNGVNLMDAIIQKDMLHYLHLVYINLADKAVPAGGRYSSREIKNVSVVDIAEIRKKADSIAKEYRIIDAKIQEANWLIEMIE